MAATLFKILPDEFSPEPSYLDEDTYKLYSDSEGLHLLRTLIPSEDGTMLMGADTPGFPKPKVMRHMDGRPANVQQLSIHAAAHDAQRRANVLGERVEVKVRDQHGKLITMSMKPKKATLLDLSVSDVHQPATLPIYAAGYRLCQEGIADVMSPVIMVPKTSDYYGTWNATGQGGDFSPPQATVNQAGGQVAEINPGLTFSQYTTVCYALGGALPTEVAANADAPFRPFTKLMQVIVDKLRLARNIRVAAAMELSSNWQTSVVQTILAGAQWNEGPSSNPILVLHNAINASYLPVTGIGMSGQMWRAFIRNQAVQKFFAFKDGMPAMPGMEDVSRDFKLPPIYVDETKYTVGGALSFVWGNDVVLIHQGEVPPTSQMDVASNVTFRWTGGPVPNDGELTAGFIVRSYFDQKRGPRGSTVVVCAHNDAEVQTSGYAGALIINSYQ